MPDPANEPPAPDAALDQARQRALADLQKTLQRRKAELPAIQAGADVLVDAMRGTPKSRRDQDAERRKAKQPPAMPRYAKVSIRGDPAGRHGVFVTEGELITEHTAIENGVTIMGGQLVNVAYLTVKIPLAHCEVMLRKPHGEPRVVQGPTDEPRAESATSSSADAPEHTQPLEPQPAPPGPS